MGFSLHEAMRKICASDLDKMQRLVLFAFVAHVDKDTATAFVGAEGLARDTGLSDRAVRPVVQSLEASGILVRLKQVGPRMYRRIELSRIAEAEARAQGQRQGSTPEAAAGVTPEAAAGVSVDTDSGQYITTPEARSAGPLKPVPRTPEARSGELIRTDLELKTAVTADVVSEVSVHPPAPEPVSNAYGLPSPELFPRPPSAPLAEPGSAPAQDDPPTPVKSSRKHPLYDRTAEAWKPWAALGAPAHRFESHAKGFGKKLNDTLFWLDKEGIGADGLALVLRWLTEADDRVARETSGGPVWFRANAKAQGDLITLTRREKLMRRVSLARAWADAGAHGDGTTDSRVHESAPLTTSYTDDDLITLQLPDALLTAKELERREHLRNGGRNGHHPTGNARHLRPSRPT